MTVSFSTFDEAFEWLTSGELGLGLMPASAARILASASENGGESTWYDSPDFPVRRVTKGHGLRDYYITV